MASLSSAFKETDKAELRSSQERGFCRAWPVVGWSTGEEAGRG